MKFSCDLANTGIAEIYFTDLFEVHIIELKKQLTGEKSLDDRVRFFNASREEDLDMILTKNPGINMAIKEIKRMSLSDRVRARYEAHLKEIRDQNAREDYVRDEGKNQGRIQGRTLEKEAVIERLLIKGKKPDEIRDLCGYDLQEIEDIQHSLENK